jgi:hypothetical protein
MDIIKGRDRINVQSCKLISVVELNTVNNLTPLPYKLIYVSKYPVHTFVPILHLYS